MRATWISASAAWLRPSAQPNRICASAKPNWPTRKNVVAENRDLFARDLIARRDVEQSEMIAETVRARAELARAHLAQREAMLAQVRALQNLTRLTAPISGEVGSVSG